MEQLPAHNLAGLGYWDLGFRQVTNNRHAVTKADDIAGLKIRVVQQPMMIDLFNTLGANAVPMHPGGLPSTRDWRHRWSGEPVR